MVGQKSKSSPLRDSFMFMIQASVRVSVGYQNSLLRRE